MPARIAVLVGALLLGYGAARVVDRALTFDLRPKPALGAARPLPDSLRRPLALRLVDAGGVGILPDTARWGGDYSHATAAFHHLLLDHPPYIDDSAFAVVRRDWRTYLGRMAEYGSNGVVVPGVFQYVNFDRVGDGFAIYPSDDPARSRHVAWRRRFAELFEVARRQGFQVYLATDLLTLTPSLERYFRGRTGARDAERPELWEVYAAGFAELFDSLPQVDGVVIRIGEGGALFDPPGWRYRSAFAVKTVRAVRAMLDALLPVFERSGRTLILRTWSVGAGELGDIHTNPATYAAALGDVDSPNLVVSTKYARGDFYGYQPANPTLRGGPQRRLIEFQARREYEGFSAFPNYVAPLHQAALAELLAANPRIVGSWVWTQEGGPLHAGPMSLYPRHGFWAWIDANAYATARLARDPGADPATLAADWARRTVGADSGAVRAVAQVLVASRGVVERGLYIRPFAERALWAFGQEVPPMLWILEWDIVGGSSAVWSTVYGATRGAPRVAVAEGFEAARMARAARGALRRLTAARQDDLLRRMERSLAYEASLLETLAWYRYAMLERYRWLDTGDPRARAAWRGSVPRFTALARDHTARFGRDLDAPAYDFTAAEAGLAAARRGPVLAWAARVLLAFIVLLLVRPDRARPPLVPALAAAAVAVLSGAASIRLVVSAGVVCGAASAAVNLAWRRLSPAERERAGRTLRTGALGALAVLIAPAALRGNGHFWFLVWSSSAVRVGLVTAVVALGVWTLYGVARTARPALGGVLLASGVAGVTASVLAPDLPAMLAALDRPLAIAPMGTSFIHGVLAYFDFPRAAPWYPAIAGAVLVGAGLGLRRSGPQRGTRAGLHEGTPAALKDRESQGP